MEKYEELEFAKLDISRKTRVGHPEVIYAAGKTKEELVKIMTALKKGTAPVIATRSSKEQYQYVKEQIPEANYNEKARIIYLEGKKHVKKMGKILILTAGTSDIPVAEEAREVARLLGNEVEFSYDVGVAGIHRLFSKLDLLKTADVIIVVAGMEGALASVVGGLTSCPVIAVPTSVGYGASFGGVSALLAMLNSCAGGIAVMNIDNGFGAAILADKILNVRQG